MNAAMDIRLRRLLWYRFVHQRRSSKVALFRPDRVQRQVGNVDVAGIVQLLRLRRFQSAMIAATLIGRAAMVEFVAPCMWQGERTAFADCRKQARKIVKPARDDVDDLALALQ